MTSDEIERNGKIPNRPKNECLKELGLGIATRSDVLPKISKHYQIVKSFNDLEPKWRFWVDKKNFGDVNGLVPVKRLIERERGSIYYPYIDKIEDECFKFVVIDVVEEDIEDFKLSDNDIKRKKIYKDKRIIYFKHNSINFIYEEVKKIS
jgi:hypothetical protein